MSGQGCGTFVVIEGLDGAGTTTQARLLTEALRARNDKVVSTFEPSDGPIGTMIRQMLSMRIVIPRSAEGQPEPVTRETLALLFAADRLDHVASRVEPALARGAHVISDRYYHSSIAYQGDVDGQGGDDFDWVLALNSRARAPELTVVLEVPARVCVERLRARGGEQDLYESLEKLQRLEQRYRQAVEILQGRGQRIEVLDGTGSVEEVQQAILTRFDGLGAPEGEEGAR